MQKVIQTNPVAIPKSVFYTGVHEGVIILSKKLDGAKFLYLNTVDLNSKVHNIVSLAQYNTDDVITFKFFEKPRKISGIWFDGTTQVVL